MGESWKSKVDALRQKLGRDPDLNELLPLAREHRMTAEEIDIQRRSYGRAEAEIGSDADEAAYRAAVSRGDAHEIERLDRAAAARVAAYDRITNR